MKKVFYYKIIILFGMTISILGLSLSVFSQTKSSTSESYVYPVAENTDDLALYGTMAINCENTRVNLERVLDEAQNKMDSSLIIIFRLEFGESSKLYSIRKRNFKIWLDRYYNKKYIIALGDSVKEIGRADIYIGGKLAFGFGFKRNSGDFCKQNL